MNNLNSLRDKAYQCAVVHGWHEQEYSNEHFLCLVISELMEAVEADRKGSHANRCKFENQNRIEIKKYPNEGDDIFVFYFKEYIKDSVEDELCDACIRLLDLAGLRKANLSITDELTIRDVPFTEFVYCLCAYITNPDKSHSDWLSEHISYSLSRLFSWCRYKDIDILWHIEQKMKYNELRPYKHGDKSY